MDAPEASNAGARDVTRQRSVEEQLEQAQAQLAHEQRCAREAASALRDLNETLLRTQLQLIQAEKLEGIGRRAAGIAHEIKNPLSVLMMGIEFLSRTQAPAGTKSTEILTAMRHAVGRAEAIVRGLVNFSAPAELKVHPQDLNPVVEQSVLMVRHELVAGRVVLVKQLGSDLPLVALDAPKIEQVLVNLLLNAAHSMPNGGTLTVRTYAKELTEQPDGAEVTPADRFRAGDKVVVLEIDDTGHGIAPEQLARLFEPYFTTKPAGKGTGLGLVVSRQIIDLHGGDISLRNREEGGVRATVLFKA